MADAKFKVGDHVKHPAAPDGSHPEGEGTVETVTPAKTSADTATYKVKCDSTGAVLATEFKESELTAV